MTDFAAEFPRLRSDNYTPASPDDYRYNCFAWAAGDDRRWWDASGSGGTYWPPEAPLRQTIDAYRAAYETRGYELCSSGVFEAGYEKIALFADASGLPTHAARQLPDGQWTSKLGELLDITHTSVEDVGGGLYGETAVFLRRRLP